MYSFSVFSCSCSLYLECMYKFTYGSIEHESSAWLLEPVSFTATNNSSRDTDCTSSCSSDYLHSGFSSSSGNVQVCQSSSCKTCYMQIYYFYQIIDGATLAISHFYMLQYERDTCILQFIHIIQK